MDLTHRILLTFIQFLLLLPGVFFASWLFRSRSRAEVFFIGNLIGFVLIIYLQRLLPLKLLPLLIGLEYVIGLYLVFRNKFKSSREIVIEQRAQSDNLIWVVSAIAFVLWWVAGATGVLPAGQDPMFHVLLIGKILRTGWVPTDLSPFESLPLNYPAGSHLWIAMSSWISGSAPHVAFKMSFTPWAFLTAGLLYMLGKELTGDRLSAFMGAMLWATLVNWGGFDYMRWGGLPNMIGMLLLVAAIWTSNAETGWRRWLLIGLFCAGIMLVNHHSALTAAVVLLGIAVTDRVALGEFGDRGRAIIYGGLFTVALLPLTVLEKVWSLFMGATAKTSTFTFPEFFIPIQNFWRVFGFVVAFGGLFGLGLLLANLRDRKDLTLPAWIMSLLIPLMFFGYIYRAFAFGLYGEFYTAFTPSWFLTDMAYPMCLMAGYFVAMKDRVRLRVLLLIAAGALFSYMELRENPSLANLSEWNFYSLRTYIIYPLALVLILAAAIWAQAKGKALVPIMVALAVIMTIGGYARAWELRNEIGKVSPTVEELKDLNAFRSTIPEDALVVNTVTTRRDGFLYGWLPYWLWRECTSTPLPASEDRLDSSVEYKTTWLQPGFHECILWSHVEARPVAFITPAFGELKYRGVRLVYESRQRKLYLYDPSKL